jgi:hypothetical protein
MAQTAEILLLAPFRTCRRDVLLAVDIEGEVLVLDCLVFAVFADGRDGSVDLVFQGVALTDCDAYAVAEVFDVGERRAANAKPLPASVFRKPSCSRVASATVPSRRPAATSR